MCVSHWAFSVPVLRSLLNISPNLGEIRSSEARAVLIRAKNTIHWGRREKNGFIDGQHKAKITSLIAKCII